jgi:hypothetical protein
MMAEDRERQRDMPVEDVPREQVEDEYEERNERPERRVEEKVPQTTASAEKIEDQLEPLFEDEAAQKFRTRWLAIQSKFVDDPRDSVKQADDLVADIIKNVTMNFANRRVALEKQWNIGENVSTEDMRVTLKRYRAFFERLLTLES